VWHLQKARYGLGGDAVVYLKLPWVNKRHTRDVQGMYKGCTRDI